jgi:hypothetical protein
MAKKVYILMGLPGCGKTRFASIVDMDAIMRNGDYSPKVNVKRTSGDDLIDRVGKTVYNVINEKYVNAVVLDGLIITNQVAAKIMREIKKGYPLAIFEIHWWEPNRAICMYNDNNRRPISSRMTIKNAPFEPPHKELLEEFKIPQKRVIHRVPKRKTEVMAWKHALAIREQDGSEVSDFQSDTWMTGGFYCDYNYKRTMIKPSPIINPWRFTAFVELMERCDVPENLFKQFWDASISIETGSDSDYYGGTQYYNFYKCDLEKFYLKLKELGFVKSKSEKPKENEYL